MALILRPESRMMAGSSSRPSVAATRAAAESTAHTRPEQKSAKMYQPSSSG